MPCTIVLLTKAYSALAYSGEYSAETSVSVARDSVNVRVEVEVAVHCHSKAFDLVLPIDRLGVVGVVG